MRLSLDLPPGRALTTEVDEAHAARGHELLARLLEPAAALADREAVEHELDWATVRLSANGAEVVAGEPDYAGDPGRFVPSLSVTCRVFDGQRAVLDAVAVDGQPVAAHQHVRVSLAAMSSVSVVGHRHPETEEPFTGWQLVSTAPEDDESAGLYTVRELAAHRPAWITAMALPVGWAFRCVGNTLVDGVSPAGRTHELLISLDV